MSGSGLDNLNPVELGCRALESESARRWALVNLRYAIRHHLERAEPVELVGTLICVFAGPKELRRVAESAKTSDDDVIGQITCLLLLSGYWRTDEAYKHLGRASNEAFLLC